PREPWFTCHADGGEMFHGFVMAREWLPQASMLLVARSLWIVAALAMGLLGCADEEKGYLRVQGAAVVVLPDDTETGFDFVDDVRLDDDRIAPRDGRIAGHCTLGPGEGTDLDVLD